MLRKVYLVGGHVTPFVGKGQMSVVAALVAHNVCRGLDIVNPIAGGWRPSLHKVGGLLLLGTSSCPNVRRLSTCGTGFFGFRSYNFCRIGLEDIPTSRRVQRA